MKKFALIGLILLAVLTLTACASNSSTPDGDWSYNKDKDVFYAGKTTVTFGKTEVVKGDDNTKVLVIHAKIKNNSGLVQDLSDFDTYLTAKQKTETSNVQLTGPSVNYDTNKDSPDQKQEDNLDKDLPPGKTVDVVFTYDLINDTTVSLEMINNVFEDVGTKKIEVK